MMKQWMKCVVLMIGSLLAAPLWAGDAALYGAIAPANAGFFRVMNASGGPLSVGFNGKTTNLAVSQSSPYAFAVEGDYTVTLNGESQPLKLVKGGQQTLLWLDGKAKVINETPFKDKSRAGISVYNALNEPISLLTSNGKSVLGPVSPGDFATRGVNGVRVSFNIGQKDKILVSTVPLVLKRGYVTSLLVTFVGGQPRITVLETAQ